MMVGVSGVFAFLLSVLFLLPVQAEAQSYCSDLFSIFNIEAPEARVLDFKNVMVVRRNDDVEYQQYGALKVVKYYDIQYYDSRSENVIALTQEGNLYHITRVGNIKTARLLSGEDVYENFFIAGSGLILAVTKNQDVRIYTAVKWNQSPVAPLVKKHTVIWAATNAAVFAGLGIFYPQAYDMTMGPDAMSVPVFAVMPAVVSGLNQAFIFLKQYSHRNTYTDGFIDTHLKFSNKEQLREDLIAWKDAPLDLSSFGKDFKLPEAEKIRPLLPDSAREDIN